MHQDLDCLTSAVTWCPVLSGFITSTRQDMAHWGRGKAHFAHRLGHRVKGLLGSIDRAVVGFGLNAAL